MRPAASLCWRLSSFTGAPWRLYRRLGQTSQTINKGFLFQSSFPAYTVLFYEASCLALLEAVLFHRDVVEAVQEAGTDLTEY
jgi:hypothetical protein